MPNRVLAILAAQRGGEVPEEALAFEMWSDRELPIAPVESLWAVVERVRSVLGADAILSRTGTYRLGRVQTDISCFEEFTERARAAAGSPKEIDLWHQALRQWRGWAFGQDAHLESVSQEALRVEELKAVATEAWFDARMAAGDTRELAADLNAAMDEFPLREGFRAQKVTALARRSGAQRAALV